MLYCSNEGNYHQFKGPIDFFVMMAIQFRDIFLDTCSTLHYLPMHSLPQLDGPNKIHQSVFNFLTKQQKLECLVARLTKTLASFFSQSLCLGDDLFNRTDHVESHLGQVVQITVQNHLEAPNRILQWDKLAL